MAGRDSGSMVQTSAMAIPVELGSTGGVELSLSLIFFDFRELKSLRKEGRLRAKSMIAIHRNRVSGVGSDLWQSEQTGEVTLESLGVARVKSVEG